ncbi:MAG: hypothetical protein KC589_04080 [Nanoarchaeota archaeon]|nr:hypothetical protein [Nanoarchaeota archaeon]MCA9496095.1 hypothetical protein [Nanoarchaeota archaeon]
MELIRKLVVAVMFISLCFVSAFAASEQVRVEINEYIDQTVTFNPLKTGSGIWYNNYENQSNFGITGYLIISNQNADGHTISDIYVSVSKTQNITLPTFSVGRTGTFITNDTSSNSLILHIPELGGGENSTWVYSVNTSQIMPPLNFTSNYSDSKVLAGDNVSITDRVQNIFNNYSYQESCIYDINITQSAGAVNFSGTLYDFTFINTSTNGPDASNVTYNGNLVQNWDTLAGGCLDTGITTGINYDMNTPLNIPSTTHYLMVNSTLRYKLNSSISHLRVVDMTAVSEGNMSFEKRIISPSHPTLYGSNVTWNISGYFNTRTNITYDLNAVSFWVSRRQVSGIFTDPNTVDNDTISNASLTNSLTPGVSVNKSNPWESPYWVFNYSDIPSPIVWMDVNFTIRNDGTQLINRSITQNQNDIYIKELYLIIGYWLEIEKNITSIGNDTYHIRIDVHNKGNQVTPADTIVTIYDFVPGNFHLNTSFNYSNSPWYNTTMANNSINGTYNGTLYQWGLLPANSLNTSFAQGPSVNENTTWSVDFDVQGQGDYQVMDVFITGLDPQQVDGAGSSRAVIVSEVLDRIKSTEGIFALVASVLLLLGLLL